MFLVLGINCRLYLSYKFYKLDDIRCIKTSDFNAWFIGDSIFFKRINRH